MHDKLASKEIPHEKKENKIDLKVAVKQKEENKQERMMQIWATKVRV